jgi:hypothetical protein
MVPIRRFAVVRELGVVIAVLVLAALGGIAYMPWRDWIAHLAHESGETPKDAGTSSGASDSAGAEVERTFGMSPKTWVSSNNRKGTR